MPTRKVQFGKAGAYGPSVEQAMQQQALAQALQQRAMVPNLPQVGGTVQAKYGPGNALVDLANSLAASWNVKKANQRVTDAQKSESEMRARALENYSKSVPDDQVNVAALGALNAAPGAQLPEPVTPRSDATRELATAFGPQMQSQLAAALMSQGMPKAPEAYTLGPGQGRFVGNKQVAAMPTEEKLTDDQREYAQAVKQGYTGTMADWQKIKHVGTTINLPENKYPNSFQEALGKSDAAQLDKYRSAAESSTGMIKTLEELKKLNPTAMSGGGAQTRAQISNWLSGWTGINVTDPEVLADTQKYNAIVSKSVLDSLGGSLGAGVSNADVAFIKDTIPKLEYSPEARQSLIDYLQRRASENIQLYEQAREYGEAHNGLKGFSPYSVDQPRAPFPKTGKTPSKLKQNPDGSYQYSP